MGVQSFLSLVLIYGIFVLKLINGHRNEPTLCKFDTCNCTRQASIWWNINCTFSDFQDLYLKQQDVPEELSELSITGGRNIVFTPRTFNQLRGFRFLRIEKFTKLTMDKESFYNVTVPSLIVEILNCDRIELKTGAFDISQTTIITEIINCASVSVEKSAFNQLYNATFKDVQNLVLASGSFEFKNQKMRFGDHGPPSIISFNNVTIKKIPHQTFFSSLAQVDINNSEINEIDSEAFYASQISAISITNTVIKYLRNGAFGFGRTLIFDLKIVNCTIINIESKAIMAGINNLTVQHSRITAIATEAINSAVVKVEILDNEIADLHPASLQFQTWNTINFTNNKIKTLYTNFIYAPKTQDSQKLIYNNNDAFNVEKGALKFISELDSNLLEFHKNYFNQTCYCYINEWIFGLISSNQTNKIPMLRNNIYCRISELLADCFELKLESINIKNFTELVCENTTIMCEPYNGDTKVINTTSKLFTNNNNVNIPQTNWLALIISCTAVLIFLVIATLTIMLIRGSRWLKRKGYFRKIQYNNQHHEQDNSNDEEITAETVTDENERDISDDLTMDLLQDLSKKLDDPATHQAASEMIEQLYQKYIRSNGQYAENNNQHLQQQQQQQQDEEAHLYEELSNLAANTNHQDDTKNNDSRSILKMMEERFNLIIDDDDNNDRPLQPPPLPTTQPPKLIDQYSEPSDAAIHLYSELKQNIDQNNKDFDSLKSRSSNSNMAFRPLPDKPGSSKMN